MPDVARTPRNRRSLRTVVLLAAAWALPTVLAALHVSHSIGDAIYDRFREQREMYRVVGGVFGLWTESLTLSYGAALLVASVAIPLGAVVRMMARRRARAGLGGPLDGLRRFVASEPLAAKALTALPALIALGVQAAMAIAYHLDAASVAALLLPAAAAFAAHLALLRHGVRVLLAPTCEEDDLTRTEIDADGYTFDAVAVTPETRAAVAAMAAFPVLFTAIGLLLPRSIALGETATLVAIAAYVALTLGGAALFTRASRIAVGVDGILIKGSSRERFFAYRDIDRARVRGANLELLHGDRVILRLQLHGKDVARRDALRARLEVLIARAAKERQRPAAGFVASATRAQLGQIVHGASDYRQMAMGREQLWELLEGPAIASSARRAAAEALATTTEPGERKRLRLAAEQCAEPSVRLRIEEMLDGDEEPDRAHDATAPGGSRRVMALPTRERARSQDG